MRAIYYNYSNPQGFTLSPLEFNDLEWTTSDIMFYA